MKENYNLTINELVEYLAMAYSRGALIAIEKSKEVYKYTDINAEMLKDIADIMKKINNPNETN